MNLTREIAAYAAQAMPDFTGEMGVNNPIGVSVDNNRPASVFLTCLPAVVCEGGAVFGGGWGGLFTRQSNHLLVQGGEFRLVKARNPQPRTSLPARTERYVRAGSLQFPVKPEQETGNGKPRTRNQFSRSELYSAGKNERS